MAARRRGNSAPVTVSYGCFAVAVLQFDSNGVDVLRGCTNENASVTDKAAIHAGACARLAEARGSAL